LNARAPHPSMRITQRAQRVEPFYVMELAKAAAEMAARSGPDAREMIYLNIGEPDFTAPPLVQAAAEQAIHGGRSQYTQATGLPRLREAISGWYAGRFGLDIDPQRIVVTAGASAALQLACLALIEAGDEVLKAARCWCPADPTSAFS
jgi:aspartate/methionine/tyrosine aminotransferase